ncbi:MAG: RloB domain-containing protein, partial [Muribaculaceae bacterium]
VRDMLVDGKMDTACELAEQYYDKDSYSMIYKAIEKLRCI